MIGYVLLGVLVGGFVGYMIAYSRFGNAKLIEELRSSYGKLEQELADQTGQLQEFAVQNKILKSRAQQLLDQNEDYSKVISQLSRYYFRLKQAHDKLKELSLLVSVVEEEDLAHKLDTMMTQTTDWEEKQEYDPQQGKFF